uniref:Uncharacterized protein n=1 Tax=Euplotes harpa TaxID=151035 RepID=A0A7S3NER0_9SPIT
MSDFNYKLRLLNYITTFICACGRNKQNSGHKNNGYLITSSWRDPSWSFSCSDPSLAYTSHSSHVYADTEYNIQEMKFINYDYPDVTGLTSPQLELIAQGIAACSLKNSLKYIWVMREEKGIGKEEAQRVLEKYGLADIQVK